MDIKALIAEAAEHEDHSEVQEGGNFEYVPPKEGTALGRFIEYIELGAQPEFFEGKEKPNPVEMVRVTFEFTFGDRVKEIEHDGKKIKIAERVSFEIAKKHTEKAKFTKLFKAMSYGRPEIKHLAQMLGEAFIFKVFHNTTDKNGKKRTYANIWKDQVFHINAPRREDPLTGSVEDISSKIPEAISPIRVFFWASPTKETWDSLFIDGEREVKAADGTVTKESKNWLQEQILSAKDFKGSALQQMVSGLRELPTGSTGQSEKPAEQSSSQTASNEQEKPAEEQPKQSNPADDLSALGL